MIYKITKCYNKNKFPPGATNSLNITFVFIQSPFRNPGTKNKNISISYSDIQN